MENPATGQRFTVRPIYKLDRSMAVRHDLTDAEVFVKGVEGAEEIIRECRQRMAPDLEQPEFPRVVFLGTGSSKPSKYRNVSSVLVEVEKGAFIIMDCGEGE